MRYQLFPYAPNLSLEFSNLSPKYQPNNRTINKSPPPQKNFNTESLSLHHISTKKYVCDKQILDGKIKNRGFNCLRNTEKQDQSAFPRNCGGMGGKRKWRWRVDNVGESRDNRRYMLKALVIPRSGMIRGAHAVARLVTGERRRVAHV